jgi:outer membrane lipoprotein-sorting protein
MKKHVVIMGTIILCIIVGLSGCTQENTSSDEKTIESTPPSEESLGSILEKTDSIDSMYYEITALINISGYGSQTAQIQIWQKPPYVKEQITGLNAGVSGTMVIIHRPEGNYTYDAAQGTYVLSPEVTSFSSWLQYFDSKTLKGLLDNQSLANLQTVTFDGKTATLFDYALSIQGVSIRVQMWIWNEYGVPLKAYIDMDTKDMAMTLDLLFSNYSFSEIPDSTFSVS